ncbi:MAG TPA: enoyl-CoA hydratase-related protein [Candidatus Binatia bacterium]|nr:enoyl-CoA hydratase-related protein [Candidatus Binatia bacterium]
MPERSYEFIKLETQGRILIVTINRPESFNSLHPPANIEMGHAFDDFAADDDQWVAIVTGAGEKAFSAGNDLKWTAQNQGKLEIPPRGFGGLTSRFDLFKPVIAAVNGVALGGGFEIALACDIIVASSNAKMGLPEPRVGLAALATGMHRLPRQIGLKNAMGMMLTGRHIDAAEGYRLGLVQEVMEPGKALERALAWANEILECAPLSVRATKQVASQSLGRPLEEAVKAHYPAVTELFKSEDFVEGPRAFAEKRKPSWKGR